MRYFQGHSKLWMWRREVSYLAIFLSFSALVAGYLSITPLSQLQQVINNGELRVVTRNAATTYYQDRTGPTGLEYDLARKFAEHLGVKLVINTTDNLDDILAAVESGSAHLAAAGLTITENRRQRVDFGTPYQQITQQLIYRSNNLKPRTPADLVKGNLEVIANSSHAEQLQTLKATIQNLSWKETSDDNIELFQKLSEGEIDFTVADSNDVMLNRRYYPNLRVAFNLTDKQPLAWAFSRQKDKSLIEEANNFILTLKVNGELDRLIKHHYTHAGKYDFIGTSQFLRQASKRLPRYQRAFEEAAMQHKLDWQLLAAIAYQESHWNPYAVSPTGVRGIMMLTRNTAKELGVERRTNAIQSINGGAEYLRKMMDRVPEYIPEPDRTWMAIAAYNVGFGHLMDARELTRLRGGDENKWTDVKETLPLLRQRKWYRKTRYGYARGHEPVKYVETIRSYYDVLNWYLQQNAPQYNEKSIFAFNSSAL